MMNFKLSNEQLNKYKEDGFLIIENFCTDQEIEKVTNEMKRLINQLDEKEVASIFTTSEQERHSDDYFLSSSDTIKFFFEKDALSSDGKLVVPKEIAFNKVGHALHNLNPVFEEFSYSSKIHDLIYSLGYKKALSVQSMYIFKNQRIGGYVNIHQDSTFLHTTPLTTHAIWFAFEDATIENGCLRGLAGSHKNGITKRFIKNNENKCVFDPPNLPTPDYNKDEFVALECKKGSIILLDGAVLHYSEPNKSQNSRHAYTLHFIEGGDDNVIYEKDNWLQSSQPFRAL